MSSSLPEGYRLRGVAESDVAVAAALIRAEERALRGESVWAIEDTIDFWRLANLDEGAWIVEASDGKPAAFAATMERGDEAESWVCVHPEHAGRGLATTLLAKSEQRVRDAGMRKLKVGALSENEAALRLFEQLGYRQARHYYQMRIELDRLPDPPDWPEGITLSAFQPDDARAFYEALHEAFADDWSNVSLSFDEWKRLRLDASDVDFSLWFVARDADEIAGAARCNARQGGGWIDALAVRKPWRKRGVGLALLRHAFVEFHSRGKPHVGLGVDAENPTGATRLYERAGMRVVTEDVVFEKELA
jgi:mycothiol synthase